MERITSPQNPLVKQVKSLALKKNREEQKLFFIEGNRFVEEAVKSGARVQYVLVTEHFCSAHKEFMEMLKGMRLFLVSEKLMEEMSDTETPQGILAVLKIREYHLEDLFTGDCILAVLDSIQDPGNMGTIIRTADAAGISGIILSKGCVDIYNPKVLRSTMGSVFHIPFFRSECLEQTLDLIREKGIKVYAADMDGQNSLYELDFRKNTAFIIGNEARGISAEAAARTDGFVRIPMPGKAESLNAAVAAGLLMYESVRQRLSGQ